MLSVICALICTLVVCLSPRFPAQMALSPGRTIIFRSLSDLTRLHVEWIIILSDTELGADFLSNPLD
jgi:hypothetical protein